MSIPMPKTVRVDSLAGNDTTAQPYDLSLPFASPIKAVAAMQPGDTLLIGAGAFDFGFASLSLPNNSIAIGRGRLQTTLTKRAVGADPSNALLKLGTNCTILNMGLNVVNGGNGVYGAVISGANGMTVRGCGLSGFTDVFYNIVGGRNIVDRCEIVTRFDACRLGVGPGTMDFWDSLFFCPKDIANDTGMSFLQSDVPGWVSRFHNCRLDGSLVPANIYGLIYATAGEVDLTDTTIISPSTQLRTINALDPSAISTGIIRTWSSNYDRAKVVGTVQAWSPV